MALKEFTLILKDGRELQFKGFPSKRCGIGEDKLASISFVTVYTPTTKAQLDRVVVGGSDEVRQELIQRLAKPVGLYWKFTPAPTGARASSIDVTVGDKLVDLNISVAEALTDGGPTFTAIPIATPNTQGVADGLSDVDKAIVEDFLAKLYPEGIIICWDVKLTS